jgi:CubicO group peptidase (beta-lactamase class C family)
LVFVSILSLFLLQACSTLPSPLSEQERRAITNSGGKADLLENMLTYQNTEKIDTTLIFKDGQLVLERYANGYDSDALHDVRSATKSITSLLIGIAIEKGVIKNEEQSILDYFPERRARHLLFQEIRIKDLLTMSSGLESDDWIPSSIGNEEKMYVSRSWIDFFFSLPIVDKPGERFRYSTAGVILLGEIIKRASGLELEKFADDYLFRDLGIVDYKYAKTPAGETDAGGHLRLKPRDFAKIGLLVLQNGKWNGKQLVSESWIRKINEPAFIVPGAPKGGPYIGYLWWQEPVVDGEVRSFQARGNGGQYLIAVPSEKILGVFTGSAFNDNKQMQPFLLMKNFVIPAFKR